MRQHILLTVGALLMLIACPQALLADPPGTLLKSFLSPDRPTSQNTFGWDIVTFQDTVFISDPFTPEGGAVYQFGQDGSLLRKIYYPGTFASNSPRFGDAISVVGNHLVVGATFDGASASGSVYVYSALTGSPERQINSPSPAGAFQQFGQSFASSGNQLIIGNSTSSSSFFGEQVATTGNQVFIAAPQESQIGAGAGTGVVHSFDLNSGSFIRTMGGDLNDPHRLGSALAVAGNGLLAGDFDTTHGRAYLFDVNSGNVLRMFDQPAGTDNAWYGTPVTAVGNFDVIASQTFQRPGAVYFYDTTGQLVLTINSPNQSTKGNFAQSLEPWGNDLLVGAPDNSNGASGIVYLFSTPIPEPSTITLAIAAMFAIVFCPLVTALTIDCEPVKGERPV